MRLKINTRKIFLNILEYAFLIILVLNCNTIWTSYEDTQLNNILKVCVVIITLLYILANKSYSRLFMERVAIFGCFSLVYFFIYAVVVGYHINSFLYFLIDAFCIYIFVMIVNQNKNGIEILYKYENVILTIAIIALFFWFFGSILSIIKPTETVYSTWTGNDSIKTVPTYYNLYFETQRNYMLIRNTAIFTEGPMYNFHLCICLLIELFSRVKISRIRFIILIVSILTTMTITGICLIIISFLFKYIFDNKILGFSKILRVCIIPVLSIIAIVAVQYFLTTRLGSNSGSTRVDDFVAGYKAWMLSPLFGGGFGNNSIVKQFMSSFRSNNQGFSNSPMRILYQGGLFLMIPYIYFIIKWIQTCIKTRDMQWFLLFACFLFLFTITVTPYQFLSIFIFMMYDFKRTSSVNNTSNK